MTTDARRIGGIDHVSLPMRNTDAMVAFYRGVGFEVIEQRAVVSVHAGAPDDQLPPP